MIQHCSAIIRFRSDVAVFIPCVLFLIKIHCLHYPQCKLITLATSLEATFQRASYNLPHICSSTQKTQRCGKLVELPFMRPRRLKTVVTQKRWPEHVQLLINFRANSLCLQSACLSSGQAPVSVRSPAACRSLPCFYFEMSNTDGFIKIMFMQRQLLCVTHSNVAWSTDTRDYMQFCGKLLSSRPNKRRWWKGISIQCGQVLFWLDEIVLMLEIKKKSIWQKVDNIWSDVSFG